MKLQQKTLFNWVATYHRMSWSTIPIPHGKKAPTISWKRYQSKLPSKGQLAEWFRNANRQSIAVVLGEVSGGLACRDFDKMRSYEEWSLKHSSLAKMLPTVQTGRGTHVYFEGHVEGIESLPGGELRCSRHCCILPPSTHPDGSTYKWIIPPLKENLLWFEPDQIESLFCDAGNCHVTERTERTEENRRGSGRKWKQVKKNNKIERVMFETLPTEFRTRHRRIFNFARSLKSMPEYANADPRQFKAVVKEWHKRALPNIRTKPFVETWIDFLAGWRKIKYRIGKGPMSIIVAKAKKAKIPSIALKYYPGHPQLQFLVSLCRELQIASGRKPFFLSARTAAKHLDVSPMSAWRWLFLLVQDDILKVIYKGGTARNPRKATRYKYIHTLKK